MTPEFRDQLLAAVASVPHGWCDEDKSLNLAALIIKHKPKLCVEIGVYAGKSLIAQALTLAVMGQGGMIYGIDPWKKESAIAGDNAIEHVEWWSKLDYHDIHRHAVEAIWRHGLDNHAVLLRTTSLGASTLFGPKALDMVHLDGNHSEQTSTQDVALWLPRLKKGGIFVMDDTDWPSTQKAVNMLSDCEELLRLPRTDKRSEVRFYLK